MVKKKKTTAESSQKTRVEPTTEETIPEESGVDETDTELYDILIPPGVPRKMIAELLQKHDVELVVRKERLYFANMTGDERELLAFRGKQDVILAVEEDMIRMLDEYIGPG
jgi:hypothetical protein